ncbi:hypothetical protein [Methanofervidicoccus sp. A16]|uniref:hypothetical protein n=1 Tax=Methanofervidicoccus sp. A16 TaxID=2607662 RepID=UPI001237242C|nr:hypothetical protein [Methanofervidicoccus sp. A16]
MHLESVAAPMAPQPPPDSNLGDPNDNEENNNADTGTDATQLNNNPTVRAPAPIGAVVVSIAVVLYIVYRGVEQD